MSTTSLAWIRFLHRVALTVCLVTGFSFAQTIDKQQSRVIMLGFDGMDAALSQDLMDKGKLPFLKRLSESGTFEALQTTNPAQSPVSWASLNTGTNPGKTGVTGFVKRDYLKASGDSDYQQTPGPAIGLAEQTKVTAAAISEWLGEDKKYLALGGLLAAPIALFLLLSLLLRWRLSVGWAVGMAGGGVLGTLLYWDQDGASPWPAVGALIGCTAICVGFFRLAFARARFLWGLAPGLFLGAVLCLNFALFTEELPKGEIIPSSNNPVKQKPFWLYSGREGIKTVAYQPAMTFPVEIFENSKILAGLGVPCARGSVGEWFIFGERTEEDDPEASATSKTATAGIVEKLVFEKSGSDRRAETQLKGPRNFILEADLRAKYDKAYKAFTDAKEARSHATNFEQSVKLNEAIEDAEDIVRDYVARLSDDYGLRAGVPMSVEIPEPPLLDVELMKRALEAIQQRLDDFTDAEGDPTEGGADQLLDQIAQFLGNLEERATDAWYVARFSDKVESFSNRVLSHMAKKWNQLDGAKLDAELKALQAELQKLEQERKDAKNFQASVKTNRAISMKEAEINFLLLKINSKQRLSETEEFLKHRQEKLYDKNLRATVTIQGQRKQMAAGEWSGADGSSDFFELTFVLKKILGRDLLKSNAICRARVSDLYPFKMYVAPLNLDPANQPPHLNVSAPRSFGRDLEKMLGGKFETLGWACATHPLKDDLIDEQTFLQDIEIKWEMRKKLLKALLEREGADERLMFFVFGETDRVQHMMFRFSDPQSPLYDEGQASTEVTFFGKRIQMRDAIDVIYEQADRLCEEIYDTYVAQDPNAVFLVVSDHGFSSFRRQFNLMNWLKREGYLVIADDQLDKFRRETHASELFSGVQTYGYVDWSKTRAYSIGLGKVYIHRADRETVITAEGETKTGIVKPEEYDALLDEIIGKLLKEKDPESGKPVFRAVHKAKDIYQGNAWQDRADLYLGFQYGFRVSWESTLGGFSVDAETKEFLGALSDNDLAWSGDHCGVDPGFVAGVFWSNKKFAVAQDDPDPVTPPKQSNPPTPPTEKTYEPANRFYDRKEHPFEVTHIAPTILDLVGLTPPAHMDRKPLKMR